jgi:hypothetical protein
MKCQMPSMGGIGSYTNFFLPQTRNKRTRIIRLCDTCRQSWSFYDLTVGFVQDVQRQKLPSPEKSLRSRFSRRCRCLSSSEVLHFALTIISSSRSLSICFVKRDYSGCVYVSNLQLHLSVNHFYLIFVNFFLCLFSWGI